MPQRRKEYNFALGLVLGTNNKWKGFYLTKEKGINIQSNEDSLLVIRQIFKAMEHSLLVIRQISKAMDAFPQLLQEEF